MKIELGDFDLVYSGVIIQIKDQPIKITIPDEVEGDFILHLKFTEDPSSKEALTKTTPLDKFNLEIEFSNFDGFAGGGNSDLLEIGTLRKIPLYLNYRVFQLSSGNTLIYCLYTRKEVRND